MQNVKFTMEDSRIEDQRLKIKEKRLKSQLRLKIKEAGAYIDVKFTFCTTSRNQIYSQQVNNNEIDPDKQNKTLVQRKQITTETCPRFSLLV